MARANLNQCSGTHGCGHYDWVHASAAFGVEIGCTEPGCRCRLTFEQAQRTQKEWA